MRSIALLPILLVSVLAQSSTTPTQPSGSSVSTNPSLSIDVTVALTTSSVTTTSVSISGPRRISVTTVVPTTFNATITSTATITPSSSASPTPVPITLATKIDPAFGVLGAILIITGLPSAFWGHKNRWTSFFLIGFYTLSLVCVVLILKFGVLAAINPPNKTLRGMFVLASLVAGVAGGGISVFFWKAAKYFIGAWGGFAFGLYMQCFRDGGLIDPVSLRWIMYIGCGAVGFVLCTIPRFHWHVLLVSTAFVGASAFMLGVDCYTTAGLKEFYLWNLGFKALFPKFVNNGIRFPVSQTMQIELGLMGAVALMGGAVQLRILAVLQRKLREISEEQKKRDEEAELQASERFAGLSKEREEWERDHPSLTKHGRQESGFNSTTPLIKDGESETNDKRSSTLTFGESRQRHLSGLSDPTSPSDDEKRLKGPPQSPGALPAMDLGVELGNDVPRSFLQPGATEGVRGSRADIDELARKEALLDEIQTIRKSIDNLRSGSSSPDSRSHRPSVTSRRTLSYDLDTALGVSHLRPPRQADPGHARVQSIGEYDRLGQLSELGASIGRPTSVPLKDANWDRYVQDRKLLQPPLGVTAPIATTPIAGANLSKVAMPSAVSDALAQRKQRESALEQGLYNPRPQPLELPRLLQRLQDDGDGDDVPLAKVRPVSNVPTTILPPRKVDPPTPQSPNNLRTATYEELSERHRQKMREMQAPLTQAEKKQADVAAAKNRWERSNAMEREAVTKRQAEQAALLAKEEKKRKSEEGREKNVKTRRGSITLDNTSKTPHSHSRSLSADKLAALGGSSSKRASAMKVEGWQKSQEAPNISSKRESRARPSKTPSPIPFPDTPTHRDDRRRASGLFRDPPN